MSSRVIGAALLIVAACGGDGTTNPSDVPEFRIVNMGSQKITVVNISMCSDSQWGENRAGGGLKPGQRKDYQLAQGCYDFRAGRPSGDSVLTTERRGILIAVGFTFLWEVGL